MAEIVKGSIVTLPKNRPPHWNKKGQMDHFLGKQVTVTSVWNFTNGDGTFTFEYVEDGNKAHSGWWKFLISDLSYKSPVEQLDEALSQARAWKPEVGQLVTLTIPVKIFRDLGDEMDVCDDIGSCLKVSKKLLHKPFIEQLNTNYIMKAMKDAVLVVAKQLCKANNTVTTLEIKVELRRDYPYYFWTQQIVSDYMTQFAGDGLFTYTDNGVYRVYSLATAPAPAVLMPVNTSVPTGISKVSGTLATVTPKVKGKRGRPRKDSTFISASDLLVMATDSGFQHFLFHDGSQIGKLYIRSQKKSPAGYIRPKLKKVSGIVVNGKIYTVK